MSRYTMKTIEIDGEQYVTASEVARLFGVSRWTIHNWEKAGRITATRMPVTDWRIFSLDVIREFYEQKRSAAGPR